MTDRSKSPRKRRLQLNAEEFAPPSDMYDASEEPRLDQTWVQFYGGEQRGIKRLSDLDDEKPVQTNNDDTNSAQQSSPSHIIPPQLVDLQTVNKTSQVAPAEQTKPSEPALFERRPRPVLSSVNGAKEAKTDAAPRSGSLSPLGTEADAVPQVIESSGDIVPDKDAAEAPLSRNPEVDTPSFEEWSRRWSLWLKRGGSIKVCEAFFRLTHSRGDSECFTSNSEIMKLSGLSRAQCIRNIHYLIEIGFLDELSEVNNKEAKGTFYRFNLVPTSLVTSDQ